MKTDTHEHYAVVSPALRHLVAGALLGALGGLLWPWLAWGATVPAASVAELRAGFRPGNTVELAPGIYEGPLDFRTAGCTAALPCVLHSTGATIRGMRAPGDWQALAPDLFIRVMEPSVDPIMAMANNDGHDQFDEYSPGNVYQSGIRADGQHTALGWAGWDVFTPADGQWSYHRTTHVLYVNPYGMSIGNVLVPFLSRLLQPGPYQTFDGIQFEGSRGAVVDGQGRAFVGLVFRNGGWGYAARYGARINRAPGIALENWFARWIGRGVQPASNDAGGFCGRLFGANGGHADNFVCEHVGSSPGHCPTCDPPWNALTHSVAASYGRGLDIKQTDTFSVTASTFRDGGVQGAVHVDCSWHALVRGNLFDRFGLAITTGTQTPAGAFQYAIDAVIQDNIITACDRGMSFDATRDGVHQATLSGNQITGTRVPYSPQPLPANVDLLDPGTPTTSSSTSTLSSTSSTSSSSTSTSTSATVTTFSSSTTSFTTSSSSTTSTSTSSSVPTTVPPPPTTVPPPPTTLPSPPTTVPQMCRALGDRCSTDPRKPERHCCPPWDCRRGWFQRFRCQDAR